MLAYYYSILYILFSTKKSQETQWKTASLFFLERIRRIVPIRAFLIALLIALNSCESDLQHVWNAFGGLSTSFYIEIVLICS